MTTNSDKTQYFELLNQQSLAEKQIYCATINGVSLAVCRSKDTIYAVKNLCTHAASTFDDGRVRGHFIVCPLHGVMFDMRTGEPSGNLAKHPLTTYPTRVNEQNMIEVGLPVSPG